jgi:hypothetical protein
MRASQFILLGVVITEGCVEPTRPVNGYPAPALIAASDSGTHVEVCPGDAGTYATITEGLAAVPAGGTVEVCPGRYPEMLVVDKAVTIEGSALGAVTLVPTVAPPDRVVWVTTAEPVTIANLTIDYAGQWGVFALGRFDLTVERVTILRAANATGLFNDASASGGRARAILVRNVFDGGVPATSGTGPFIGGDVDAVIERNVVRRTTFSCIQVQSGALDFGVPATTAPAAEIAYNDVDQCGRAGGIRVRAGAGAVVDVVGNTVRNSTQDPSTPFGIIFGFFPTSGVALGRIERNTVVDYVQPDAVVTAGGVQITGVAQPVVRYNDIAGNAHAGLRVAPTAPAIDARCNWWGAADGPSGDGPGSGDAVVGAATVVPFATGSVASFAGDADRRACLRRM